jgi:hypothetical protein
MDCATRWIHAVQDTYESKTDGAIAVRFYLMIHQFVLWPGKVDPCAIAAAIRVMVAG